MEIDYKLNSTDLSGEVARLWAISAEKITLFEKQYDNGRGAPVYTVRGNYTSRGWTEWTQGFLYGSMLLQFDATGEEMFLTKGRDHILASMAGHISHCGVHDHGFNNVSTYGNLLRMNNEGRYTGEPWEREFYQLALKLSGAVQASRWTELPGDLGYVFSFNGPHSLFADTIRSMRVLALSHALGHVLLGEQDERINMLERLLRHMETTARYNVYYGEGRDHYDVRGRVAHESIFNTKNGRYRCPNSQQGFSPFTTWMRGLAWIILGYAEQLEFLAKLAEGEYEGISAGEIRGKQRVLERFLDAAEATADFYIDNTPADGIPYWDTGAPGLARMGEYLSQPANPFNDHEPVDSSAAAIAAQGLLRLARYLDAEDKPERGKKYLCAALRIAKTLFAEPYLSTAKTHQGLILHSVYHRPNGWDYIPENRSVPCGESSMWGDYHARELALLLHRMLDNTDYPTFFYNCIRR